MTALAGDGSSLGAGACREAQPVGLSDRWEPPDRRATRRASLRSAGTGLADAGEDQRSMSRRLACARGDMGHRRGACFSVSAMHPLRQAGDDPQGLIPCTRSG